MEVDTATRVSVPLDVALPVVERLAVAIEALGFNIQASVFAVSVAWVIVACVRRGKRSDE